MSEFLFTSESVSEGHPDKVADQISDAVLDAILKQDKTSRVAAETLVKDNLVVLAGEITTGARVNYNEVVRRTINRIGYNDPAIGFDTHTCTVIVAYGEQSQNIAQGVDEGKGLDLDQGAGDQGLMFGYACDETPGLMPLPIYLSHRLVERQSEVRRDGRLPWLRPDAKSQVTIKYANGRPDSIDTVVLSTQHAPGLTHKQIEEAVIEQIIKPVLPKNMVKGKIKYLVNPTGALRDRRSEGRLRPHRAQDHRRHLWRLGAARRRRVLRQGPVQGGPLGRLRGALRGEEHRRRGAGRQVPGAGVLRHRRRAADQRHGDHAGHGQALGREAVRSWCCSTSTCGRRASSRCWTCCGRSTRRPRPTGTSGATSPSSPGKRPTRRWR